MNYSKAAIGAIGLSIFLSGCGTTATDLRPNLGVAVNAAMDGQIVSTAAVPGAPVMDPVTAAAAIQRYHDDEVKQPEVDSLEVD